MTTTQTHTTTQISPRRSLPAGEKQKFACRQAPTRDETQTGFTLLELLIVMVIIGLLVALVAPKFTGRLGDAKTKTSKAQIEMLSSALETYSMDMGDFPTTEQGLAALLNPPLGVDKESWRGPYIKKLKLPVDAWKRPFIYKGSDDRDTKAKRIDYIVISFGKDGMPGGVDEDKDLLSYE